MTIKIVTDSTADLPPETIKELGITVLPLYLRFGNQVYRDHIDITGDEFYDRLIHDPIHPSTTQIPPQDFIEVYHNLSQEADGIISIHLTSRLSGTYDSALQAKESVGGKCQIEVVDSQLVTMGLGLLVIAAANLAKSVDDIRQIVEEIKHYIPKIHLLGLLDTLKYLALGGRIGKVQALLGSILSVKPMLSIKDGVLVPSGRVRNRVQGIDKLFEFVKNTTNIQELSVIYNTTLDDATALAARLGNLFPRERIRIARLGPALGVHGGPNILFVALRSEA
ncbi:MAG: DegV family protein [Dehalococcoidales bacterium]|nr:DegV family protein [Dehalococcoidales bacterium]